MCWSWLRADKVSEKATTERVHILKDLEQSCINEDSSGLCNAPFGAALTMNDK